MKKTVNTEEQYINNLKDLIVKDDQEHHIHYKVLQEKFINLDFNINIFEDKIKENKSESLYECRKFDFANYKWSFEIRTFNFHVTKDNVNISIQCDNIPDHDLILSKFIICFRNVDNPFRDVKMFPSSLFFFSNSGENGYKTYIFKDEYNQTIAPLVKNGNIKVGIYIRMYDPNDGVDKLFVKLKNRIPHDEYYFTNEQLFECAVDNLNQFESDFQISLRMAGYTWHILLFPNNEGNVDFKLELSIKSILFIFNLNIFADLVFYIRNGNDFKCIEMKEYNDIVHFTRDKSNITFKNFMKSEDLYVKRGYSNKSLVENNRVVFGFFFRIYDTEKKHKSLIIRRKPDEIIEKERKIREQLLEKQKKEYWQFNQYDSSSSYNGYYNQYYKNPPSYDSIYPEINENSSSSYQNPYYSNYTSSDMNCNNMNNMNTCCCCCHSNNMNNMNMYNMYNMNQNNMSYDNIGYMNNVRNYEKDNNQTYANSENQNYNNSQSKNNKTDKFAQ